jgi:S-adenosylmethionine:tRNA-ribosyltransferase-isomerase (queuine synthetase)
MTVLCDYSELLKKHPNKWVALSSNGERVVAVGDTVKEVLQKAAERKESAPILTKTAKDDGALIV